MLSDTVRQTNNGRGALSKGRAIFWMGVGFCVWAPTSASHPQSSISFGNAFLFSTRGFCSQNESYLYQFDSPGASSMRVECRLLVMTPSSFICPAWHGICLTNSEWHVTSRRVIEQAQKARQNRRDIDEVCDRVSLRRCPIVSPRFHDCRRTLPGWQG